MPVIVRTGKEEFSLATKAHCSITENSFSYMLEPYKPTYKKRKLKLCHMKKKLLKGCVCYHFC